MSRKTLFALLVIPLVSILPTLPLGAQPIQVPGDYATIQFDVEGAGGAADAEALAHEAASVSPSQSTKRSSPSTLTE